MPPADPDFGGAGRLREEARLTLPRRGIGIPAETLSRITETDIHFQRRQIALVRRDLPSFSAPAGSSERLSEKKRLL
jgi:hypothetical protein